MFPNLANKVLVGGKMRVIVQKFKIRIKEILITTLTLPSPDKQTSNPKQN